jgi:ankyrin repeat protein
MKNIIAILCILLPAMVYSQSKNDSLFIAIKNQNIELLNQLIRDGADINYVKESGSWLRVNPSIKAVQTQNIQMVKVLIEQNIDINWIDSFDTPALFYAVSNGQIDMVKLLIEKDANLYLKDKQGNDVISIAKKSGNKQLLKYLKKLVKLN